MKGFAENLSYDLNVLGGLFSECEVKTKVAELCYPAAVDGGDDPRGATVVDAFICHKAKCRGGGVGVGTDFGVLSRFGNYAPSGVGEVRRVKRVCAPLDGFVGYP